MKKLAIIGASYLQNPLILKARSMGIETHVFAWAANDVGEKSADYFYPISITEKEEILKKCKQIDIDGICSIASDLAAITVNYVAVNMGLIGNSLECTRCSTNKFYMRECFRENGDPSPKSILVDSKIDIGNIKLEYPIIVKSLDRSGSRGITKLEDSTRLNEAIDYAMEQGFVKKALIEEFVSGDEYSIECISWKGTHYFLAMTKKYTTGAPHFIEMAHLEPAPVSDEVLRKVKEIVFHALDSLKIENGASHTEVKIDGEEIKIIEIGGRMGGDCIGSHLVEMSTGIDFVKAVIQIALNEKPDLNQRYQGKAAAIRYIFNKEDVQNFNQIKAEHPEYIVASEVGDLMDKEVTDSSNRFGYYLLMADTILDLEKYLEVEN